MNVEEPQENGRSIERPDTIPSTLDRRCSWQHSALSSL